MSATKRVYLIGDANSPKTNQWLQMTNCKSTAEAALAEAGEGATFKEVTVRPKRAKK
jgi:hypothetical protein